MIKITATNILSQRMKKYFKDIINTNQTMREQEEENETNTESADEQDQRINIEEIEETITKVKLGKTVGHDNVTSEMIKNLEERSVEIITKLFNRIWTEERRSEDWEIGKYTTTSL